METRKPSLAADAKAAAQVVMIALPLSLGISLAAGAPALAGLLTASVGAIIASVAIIVLGGSKLTIKGPAAGLIVVMAGAITTMGYENALGVFCLAGLGQIILAVTGLGKKVLTFISPAAIHGMLAAIGITIIAKQLYVWFGLTTTHTEPMELLFGLPQGIASINEQSFMVGFGGLAILYTIHLFKTEGHALAAKLPAALIAVVFGVGMGLLLSNQQHISIPHTLEFTLPVFAKANTILFWEYVMLICLIGSLESLLTVKAVDSKSNLSRDLLAVGIANTLVSCIGGLPMISEVTRSSANKSFGATTTWSNLFQGLFLAGIVLCAFMVPVLEYIPMASLAAVLIFSGYRLASRAEWLHMWSKGKDQFVVFLATVIVTLLTDLLLGVMVGTLLHIAGNVRFGGVKPRQLLKYHVHTTTHDGICCIQTNCASVLHQNSIVAAIQAAPQGCELQVDLSGCQLVDASVLEAIQGQGRQAMVILPENGKALGRGKYATIKC